MKGLIRERLFLMERDMADLRRWLLAVEELCRDGCVVDAAAVEEPDTGSGRGSMRWADKAPVVAGSGTKATMGSGFLATAGANELGFLPTLLETQEICIRLPICQWLPVVILPTRNTYLAGDSIRQRSSTDLAKEKEKDEE
ncbi:hypothetical protein BS78_10G178100 [Paspalum vaginatum]|nr:hypothetical protein BS78_10G178100 [Paspalum vaginatum]